MGSHVWVAIQYTILSIEKEPDGTLTVSATNESIQVATDEAVYGCWLCNTILSPDTFETECQQ